MGMRLQILPPGEQYAEETDLCPEMLGIAGISSSVAALACKSRLYIARLFWSASADSS